MRSAELRSHSRPETEAPKLPVPLCPTPDRPVPNAAFRIAFWTMCCAVTLSLAVALSNPQSSDLVRHLQGATSPDGDASPLLDVRLGSPGPWSAASRLASSDRSSSERAAPAVTAQYSPEPLRTASAAPDLPTGLVQLDRPEEIEADDELTPPKPRPTDLRQEEPESEADPSRSIDWPTASRPVPPPEDYTRPAESAPNPFPEHELSRLRSDLTRVQMTRIERELAELRSAERDRLQELAREELASIGDELARYRERIGIAFDPPRLAGTGQFDIAQAFPAEQGESESRQGSPAGLSANQSIQIERSPTEGRWNIRFQDADLPEVLAALGQRIGWRVVVDQHVEGRVTCEFRDADPEQVFAIIIKARRLQIDRRGDYLLISNR